MMEERRGEDYDEFKLDSNLYLLALLRVSLHIFSIFPNGVYEF